MLNVCEIFYSLQGESTLSGRPCVFIRLSGCNLRCSYCDTQYAFAPGREMDIPQIMAKVAKYPARLVEITGGEPVWQDETPRLCEELLEAGYQVMLETNGSLYLEDIPAQVIKIIDVKCPGSGCADSFMKWNLKLLQPHDELKFVLTNYQDYLFARQFIKDNSLESRTLLF